MTEVAFATCSPSAAMTDDDRIAAELLRARGVPVVAAVWDDPAVDWSRFSCVVIRSTWDYHHAPDRYAAWLRERAAAGTDLWNPPEAVLGNLDKRYLMELAGRGVEVVPSEYLPAGGGRALADVLESRGWERAVVKPAVSASAHATWQTSRDAAEADGARFEAQCRASATLVQPFVEEVTTEGEWSLIFFRDRYSHSVLKRPARGDFRVQPHCGGETVAASPAPGLIDRAREILSTVDTPLLYARVDGVDRGGSFVLMELEINEPALFLGHAPGAAERFAEAIEEVL